MKSVQIQLSGNVYVFLSAHVLHVRENCNGSIGDNLSYVFYPIAEWILPPFYTYVCPLQVIGHLTTTHLTVTPHIHRTAVKQEQIGQ